MVPFALYSIITGNVALSNDAVLTTGAISLASILVGTAAALRSRELVSGPFARKLVHTCAGILYVSLWRFWENRWAAAIVPATFLIFALTARTVLAGIVGRGDETDKSDALRGPTLYIGVLTAITVLLWQDQAAYVTVAQLCLGDAAAEFFGRALGGGNKWPFAKDKSVAGSLGFVLAGTVGSLAMLYVQSPEFLTTNADLPLLVLKILGISIACAAAELVPKKVVVDDNISVAITAALLAHWWL